MNLSCAFFCDAMISGSPTCDEVDLLHNCWAINGQIFGDIPEVPAAIGACVKTSLWGMPLDGHPSRLGAWRDRRGSDRK